MKKYRIPTLVLMFVLGVNMVMPVTIHAADYYCNIKDAHANDEASHQGLCFMTISGLSEGHNSIDSCETIQSCSKPVSYLFTKPESLLPVKKTIKNPLAVLGFSIITPSSGIHGDTFSYNFQDVPDYFSSPPIFLMTGTFLN